ncbi:hypothetical protein ACFS5L_26795 [Streptomyces phyllanthi]|uniref:Lipoprotein n=1 Tax=Streptomyces phyllanthi TaxID=1803180 RepID=A0A5N8W2P6_9ACTN|nr:hypothetical protein [Streptomyces phyllanthi]MPY41392.1 hypothetical protein [Streptomyces phyllanthi]
MRGAVRGARTAGLAAAVLLSGLTACTSGDGDGAGAGACTDGTYAWSGVRRWEKLTQLADPITIKKKTAFYSARLDPVDDTVYRPTVTGAPEGVGAGGVIKALGRHLKVEEPLAGPGEVERPQDESYYESGTGDLKGSYYSWGAIGLVEAGFTYTCGDGEPVEGRVRTWETTIGGFLPCSEPSEGEAGRVAARKVCPPGSRASKEAA